MSRAARRVCRARCPLWRDPPKWVRPQPPPAAAPAPPAPRLARDEPLPPSSAGAGTVVARETFRARPAPATEVARSVEAGSAPPPPPMAEVIGTPAAERPFAEPTPLAVPQA